MHHAGERATIPLFPVHAVLFPGGPLALRIFEPRYLDMISECLRHESGFGICLIREGEEVGRAAVPYEIGTYANITYWNRRDDGLLGITVVGEMRFRVRETRIRPNQLVEAEVEFIGPETPVPVPERFHDLVARAEGIIDELDHPYINLPRRPDDACWVGSRLAELLPIPLEHKQYFLQLEDPLERLERLRALLDTGEFVGVERE